MKKIILVMLAALVMGSGMSAQAQDDKKEKKQKKDRTEMLQKRASRLASELKLDDETTAWFTPLYVEYQDTLQAINRPKMPKKDGEKKSKKTELSDLEAYQLVEDVFAKSEKRVALQREYYKKFKEKLTAKQLVTIFVHENGRPQGQRPQGQHPQMQGGGMQGGFPGGPDGGFGGGF